MTRRARSRAVLWCLLLCCLALSGACGSSGKSEAAALTREQLLDPESCRPCHHEHVEQWASSMHAYAGDDPVFVAMNNKGQHEAKIGTFCLECHAPMAVREKAISATDTYDPSALPKKLKGVTCYFCHNVAHVGKGNANNPLELANDLTMRGGIKNPVKNTAHEAVYAAHLDGSRVESADLCGKCHDVRTPSGVHLERTHAEWQQSLFADPDPGRFLTCAGCHMSSYRGVAADDARADVPERSVHQHLMAGVDHALTKFPDRDVQDLAIRCALQNTLTAFISVTPLDLGATVSVAFESNAGHGFPSGAAQDRRAWVEVVAYDDADKVIFERGRVPADRAVSEFEDANGDGKADLFQFRDRVYGKDGEPVHMFWEAEKYVSEALPPPPRVPGSHDRSDSYLIPVQVPARVTVSAYIRPIDYDLLDALAKDPLITASVRKQLPTYRVGVWEWRRGDGFDKQITTQTRESFVQCPSRDRIDLVGPMEAHRELLP